MRLGDAHIERRNQQLTAFGWHAQENRVILKQRITGEVHLRHQTVGDIGPKQRKVNVVGTPCVVVIPPRISSRFDGVKFIISFRISHAASCTQEIRIKWRIVFVYFMYIPAGRIGLPDFNERIRNRLPVFVHYLSMHHDSFTQRLTVFD